MSKKKYKARKGIFLIIVILVVSYMIYNFVYKKGKIHSIFEEVEEETASVTEYIVYGTHLNINGSLNIDTSNIQSVSLEMKTSTEEVSKEVALTYTLEENKIEFATSDLINEGIDLEDLDINEYYIFLKVQLPDEEDKYYSLKNDTSYENVEYYTITRENKNNKIDIDFANYFEDDKKINYMYISVNNSKLPENVYDVVIDPGHRRG